MTQAKDFLNNPDFMEALDIYHKGYIDSRYTDAKKPIPIPKSLIPLSYADTRIQKGLDQLRQGAKNALYVLDKHANQ